MTSVLLADDDTELRAAMRRVLQTEGYEVAEAADGDEAIARLHQSPASVVVADVLMPGKDGIEMIKAIRERWPNCGIIAISGGGFCQAGLYLEMCEKLGASRTLAKPFSRDDLLAAVRAAQEDRRPACEGAARGSLGNRTRK